MPDKFDPYRESLIMEEVTVWPADLNVVNGPERERIERALHEDPQACAQLEYVRVHTGFCRQITVTSADLERLSA